MEHRNGGQRAHGQEEVQMLLHLQEEAQLGRVEFGGRCKNRL